MRIKIGNLERLLLPFLVLTFPMTYVLQGVVPKITEITTGILAVLGIACVVLKKRLKKHVAYCFLFGIAATMHSNSIEGVRYMLLIIALATWSHIEFNNMLICIKAVFWLGLICSVSQIAGGTTRISGFSGGSPTQFACILLSCVVFFLLYMFNDNKKVHYWFYIAVSTILIFMTGTRTVLIGDILAIGYYLLCGIIQKCRFSNKKRILFIVLIITVALLLVSYSNVMELVGSNMGRDERLLRYSNETRFYLVEIVLSDLFINPLDLLFGKGSGYVEIFLKTALSMADYLPVHQDYVLLLAEFGIFGVMVAYCLFLKRHKAKWLFLFMFTICSFHNGILNTRNMLLMMLIMRYAEYNNYRLIPDNIKRKGKKYDFVYCNNQDTNIKCLCNGK